MHVLSMSALKQAAVLVNDDFEKVTSQYYFIKFGLTVRMHQFVAACCR
jgi:hypothetical protein